jgi:hypothetical protein
MIPSLVLRALRATGRPRFFDEAGRPLLGGEPRGHAFLLTDPVTSERLVLTVAHHAVEASEVELAGRDVKQGVVRGSLRVAPGHIEPVNDVVAFAALGGGPALSLAAREPAAADPLFVLSAAAHPGNLAGVSDDGLFTVELEETLDRDAVAACVGAPIVDAAGNVVGLCVDAGASPNGRPWLTSPRLFVLRVVLARPESA